MTAGAYYNEVDPYAAQWLRNLVAAGHVAPGDVDERSIVDVRADDLRGYTQAHFFAGIGGWSVALRLAGWDDARSVWTGSCPCQPFSAAGAGKAADDERHLWPAWSSLIAECRPRTVFGEQVEAAVGWGWLDLVFTDLEAEGYACGSAILPACGVGAPHIRQRLWFVADASHERHERDGAARRRGDGLAHDSAARVLADTDAAGQRQLGRSGVLDGEREAYGHDVDGRGETGRLEHTESVGLLWRSDDVDQGRRERSPGQGSTSSGLADADGGDASPERLQRGGQQRQLAQDGGAGFWSDAEWLPCSDGKARPVEPGSFPLASGVLRRPSKLRAYGNAIVPQVAAEFVSAFMDCEPA